MIPMQQQEVSFSKQSIMKAQRIATIMDFIIIHHVLANALELLLAQLLKQQQAIQHVDVNAQIKGLLIVMQILNIMIIKHALASVREGIADKDLNRTLIHVGVSVLQRLALQEAGIIINAVACDFYIILVYYIIIKQFLKFNSFPKIEQ